MPYFVIILVLLYLILKNKNQVTTTPKVVGLNPILEPPVTPPVVIPPIVINPNLPPVPPLENRPDKDGNGLWIDYADSYFICIEYYFIDSAIPLTYNVGDNYIGGWVNLNGDIDFVTYQGTVKYTIPKRHLRFDRKFR